jgi:Short C-terminal domain
VARISRARWIFVNALIAVTTVLLIVGMFAIWANRLLFSPDNWSNTSTQLLQNQAIRTTTANYIVDELYANVNVAGVLKSGLPPRLQPLAGPAAGALRNVAVQGVELALTRPRIQNLWMQANRSAAQTFIAVVRGGNATVATKQGVVTLNLGPIVDSVASRLGLPSNVAAKLPPHIANLTILKSDQLKLVQNVGNGIQGLALWLTILVPLLYALAIALAPGRRRRTLMNVGIAAVLAGVLVLLGRSILESQIPGSLSNDASIRETIVAAISISTGLLGEVAGATILVGIPLIAAAWFAGPARPARAGREAIAPFLREHPAEAYAITLGVMALIFIWDPIPATGKPAGIAVFTLLALVGMFVLRRQTAAEFPDARVGAATQKLRARVQAFRSRRAKPSTSNGSPPDATIPQQLQQLADLRDHGEINADEYQAAKSQLLHTS